MKLLRLILALCVVAMICSAVPSLTKLFADSKPNVQLNTDNVQPHELEDVTQKTILRDYTLAWQALNNALANNTAAPLKDNFVGFALDKLTQRVKDQQAHDLKTTI